MSTGAVVVAVGAGGGAASAAGVAVGAGVGVATTLPHLDQGRLRTLILETPMLICRSGYSTIMDLYFLNKSAVIIPTPGQTEQEYLAQYHSNKHLAISQHDFSKLSMSELSSALDAFSHQKNTNHQKHETFSPLLHIKNWL